MTRFSKDFYQKGRSYCYGCERPIAKRLDEFNVHEEDHDLLCWHSWKCRISNDRFSGVLNRISELEKALQDVRSITANRGLGLATSIIDNALKEEKPNTSGAQPNKKEVSDGK